MRANYKPVVRRKMKCFKCGTLLDNNADTCPNCGRVLIPSDDPQELTQNK